MATSSIFRELRPKDKRSVIKLIRALERSAASKPQPVQMSRPVHDMTPEEIRKIFGGK